MSRNTPSKRAATEPAERLLRPAIGDPDMPRPATIMVGALLVLLRVGAGVLWTAATTATWDDVLTDLGFDMHELSDQVALVEAVLAVFVSWNVLMLILHAVLAVFIYLGKNWARIWMMVVAVGSISLSFTGWWLREQDLGVSGSLLSLGLDILILLALSSQSAAAYCRRRRRSRYAASSATSSSTASAAER